MHQVLIWVMWLGENQNGDIGESKSSCLEWTPYSKYRRFGLLGVEWIYDWERRMLSAFVFLWDTNLRLHTSMLGNKSHCMKVQTCLWRLCNHWLILFWWKIHPLLMEKVKLLRFSYNWSRRNSHQVSYFS